jgi:predicted transcriptional regulator
MEEKKELTHEYLAECIDLIKEAEDSPAMTMAELVRWYKQQNQILLSIISSIREYCEEGIYDTLTEIACRKILNLLPKEMNK